MAPGDKEQKYDIEQFVKFLPGDRVKSDVFKGKHFNTAGDKQWSVQPGSMVFTPDGIRGIKCLERMTVLGIQEPH